MRLLASPFISRYFPKPPRLGSTPASPTLLAWRLHLGSRSLLSIVRLFAPGIGPSMAHSLSEGQDRAIGTFPVPEVAQMTVSRYSTKPARTTFFGL
jgi:hypothetical protein